MSKKFYVTTPIYYANGLPHIGHAYSSFIADAYARWKRFLGYTVKFSTGVDENSQKIVIKAQELGKDTMEFLDEIAEGSLSIRKDLSISYTDFIRTTSPEHHAFVSEILEKIYAEQKDIYQGEYSGLYCVGCEAFKYERDLVNGLCPDHLTKPDVIKEKNWFFRLSSYQDKIQQLFLDQPRFVDPASRFNEIKSFVNSGLEDFSISRETNTFGIPLPFDPSQVTYVWFDALLNYITVCQRDKELNFWDDETQIFHILGKDIVKFHATYRPAMLMSAGYRLPNKEFVTGYLTVDGQKMSKSLGNIIDPVALMKDYNRDAVVFYLLYDAPIGIDGDFSWERFKGTYESALIGAWGNLVNRVVSLCVKYEITQGSSSHPTGLSGLSESESTLLGSFLTTGFDAKRFEERYLDSGDLQGYLQDWYKLVQKANEFITKAEPWKTWKQPETQDQARADLQYLLWVIKNLALLSSPVLIEGFAKFQTMFGNEIIASLDSCVNLEDERFAQAFALSTFSVNLTPEILYHRKID